MYHVVAFWEEASVIFPHVPVFHTDDFILKVTVAKVTEKLPENTEKVTENSGKVTEKLPENSNRLTENKERLIEKVSINGDQLTENKIAILTFMIEDPYISKSDLSKYVDISSAAISNNIEAMRGKYLRRVGPDKGGFWEIIE